MNYLGQIDFGGITIKILSNSESLTVAELYIPAGSTAQLHSHFHEEVNYILSGKVNCLCDNKTTILNKGDFIQIPSSSKHNLKCLPDQDSLILTMWTPSRTDLIQKMK